MNTGPLTGLRVLEFGQIAAGPFAGMLLADLGAACGQRACRPRRTPIDEAKAARIPERQADILGPRHPLDQATILMNEADPCGAIRMTRFPAATSPMGYGTHASFFGKQSIPRILPQGRSRSIIWNAHTRDNGT